MIRCRQGVAARSHRLERVAAGSLLDRRCCTRLWFVEQLKRICQCPTHAFSGRRGKLAAFCARARRALRARGSAARRRVSIGPLHHLSDRHAGSSCGCLLRACVRRTGQTRVISMPHSWQRKSGRWPRQLASPARRRRRRRRGCAPSLLSRAIDINLTSSTGPHHNNSFQLVYTVQHSVVLDPRQRVASTVHTQRQRGSGVDSVIS